MFYNGYRVVVLFLKKGDSFLNIIEVKGDLFAEPYTKGEDVYVHCVSSDFALGAGIAKTFREKFPIFVERKQEMIRKFPRAKLSGLFSVATEGHLIVNLVTKKNYWDKPTYDSMETSLRSLRQYLMRRPHITRVLMPRIGCGLDRLVWSRVRAMIETILENLDVEVKVFYL